MNECRKFIPTLKLLQESPILASVRREFNFNDSTLLAWFVRRTPQSFFGFLLELPLGPSVRSSARLDFLPARSLVETDVP